MVEHRDRRSTPAAARRGCRTSSGRSGACAGRARRRKGASSRAELDIDILLYGDRVISGPDDLHIPHLLMHERRFVLHPLADLAPELEHPVLYQTIRELLDALDDEHQVLMADLPRRWFER